MNVCIKVFVLTLLLIFYSEYSLSEKKVMLAKKDICTIFIKQTSRSQFQQINCTVKKKYPIPDFGYDKDHCVVLKRSFTYTGVNNKKIYKNKNGLYCAMDGYSDHTSWWYVK